MAIGDFFSRAYHTAAQAVDTAGQGISAVGGAVSDGAHWAQKKVESGVGAVTGAVDRTVDSFEHSSIGDNVVGHTLGEFARAQTHFTGGVVKGVTGLGTGLVGLAGTAVKLDGGALQYASNSQYREQTNASVVKFATDFAHDPTAIPRNIGSGIKNAWEHDPADFLGQAAGVVGTAVLTAGVGTAAEAAGAAGRVGAVTEGAEGLATAGRVGETLQTAGEVAEGATARSAAQTTAQTTTQTTAQATTQTTAQATTQTTAQATTQTATRTTVQASTEVSEQTAARGAAETTDTAEATTPPPVRRMGPSDLPETPQYEGYDKIGEHFTTPGKMKPKGGGVEGSHYTEDFKSVLGDKGAIIKETEVPNFEGMTKADYKLYVQERGQITSNFKSGDLEKTLFDSSQWSAEDITKLARNVFGDRIKGTTGTLEANFNGTNFIGWAREGQLGSFGVALP